MRGRRSIRQMAIFCIVVLTLFLAACTVFIWYEHSKVLTVAISENNQNVKLVNIWENLQNMDEVVGDMVYLHTGDLPEKRGAFLKMSEEARTELAQIREDFQDERYYYAYDISRMFEYYEAQFSEYYDNLMDERAGVYMRSARNELKTLNGYIENELGEAIVFHLNQTKDNMVESVQRLNETKNGLLFFSAACLAACALMIVLLVEWIIRPINSLVGRMDRFRETEMPPETNLTDGRWREIRQLNASFDAMVQEIVRQRDSERRLARLEMNNIEMKYQLDKANLDLLQAQVNPHFLFNTLNSIYALTLQENAAQTGEMVEHLSGILRYSMSSLSAFVQISREMEILEDYLYIQKIRFGEKIRFTTQVSPELENDEIPCMVIQPLVENSIMHAFKPGGISDEVAVRISRQGQDILVEVRDNGCGISDEKIERIHAGEKVASGDTEIHHGIGLDNVLKRMNILYGPGHMKIDSSAGEGTRITLIVSPRKDRGGIQI